MFRAYLICVFLAMSACSVPFSEPYQADRKPENRDSYKGIAGVVQWQKDQSYLAAKQLDDKCEQIKTRIVQAQLTNNPKLAQQLLPETADVCITKSKH
jgi:hypothetical protein